MSDPGTELRRSGVAQIGDAFDAVYDANGGGATHEELARAAVGVVVAWIRDAYAQGNADDTFSYYGLGVATDIERSFLG
jgi:hypothetical protein